MVLFAEQVTQLFVRELITFFYILDHFNHPCHLPNNFGSFGWNANGKAIFEGTKLKKSVNRPVKVCKVTCKVGLLRTLVLPHEQVYQINNTWFGFHKDIQELVTILRKNCYPCWTIDKIIQEYVNREIGHASQTTKG